MNAYVRSYDSETEWIYFFIKDKQVFKKNFSIKEEFDSQTIYKKKLKSKKKEDGDDATDFHGKKIPKVGSDCTCYAVILIEFVLKKDENYFSKVFLKECKCIEKEKNLIRYNTDNLAVSSDDSDESDEE